MTTPPFPGDDADTAADQLRTVAPVTEGDAALSAVADWGPAEDWSDWQDATGC